VNVKTTTQEFRTQLLQGWLVSCLLHGLVLVSLLPLFRQSLITLPTEPFHWDVALVQSTATADEPVQTADTTKSAVLKQLDRIATITHTNRTIRHAAPSAERSTSLDPKTEASVTSLREAATTTMPNELPPPLDQATELPRQQTDRPIDSTAQAPPQLETATAAASPKESAPPTDTTQPSPVPATASDTTAVSAVRPDYGWLQQAIFRRLEELKRSSRPSLDDSRSLKVMVRVVVSKEGMLLDSAVVTSSGLDRIDQEAMALVQRAFPMQFDRTLDRQQIVMRIPITYSRG